MQSHPLTSILRQRIDDAGGWISFESFMQAALYEHGLGYYDSATVFGSEGDFVTAAELGPWLAKGFVDLITWAWHAMGEPSEWTLMEQGGGNGALLCNILQELSTQSLPTPTRMISVEACDQMRIRQHEAYKAEGMSVEQAASLSELAPIDSCIMISNELPDAFPVRCMVKKQEALYERGVSWDGSAFVWMDNPEHIQTPPRIAPEIQQAWPDGYITEFNPNLQSWQSDVASTVQQGFVFTVDYGFTQREYYRPNRMEGTLLAHHHHQAYADVLTDPGCRDITAHVDFTALAHWGSEYGLHASGFMSQGAWLAQSPSVQSYIANLAGSTEPGAMKQMAFIKRLLMPTGMGETFKLLIQRTDSFEERVVLPPFLGSFDRLRDL